MRLTIPEEELMSSGHKGCQGCGGVMAMRYALKALGENTIVVLPACCWTVLEGEFPYTSMRVPMFHTAFETAASTSSDHIHKQGHRQWDGPYGRGEL